MKVQFYGGNQFGLKTKDSTVFLNIPDGGEKSDFIALTTPNAGAKGETKKCLNLPGEFEISGILAQGFYVDNRGSIVYKITMESITYAYFGGVRAVPETAFFEKLGENIDVAIVEVNEELDAKKAKELLGKIDPRMAIFGGEQSQMPKVVETFSAKMAEEISLEVKKSTLLDDKTEFYILPSA